MKKLLTFSIIAVMFLGLSSVNAQSCGSSIFNYYGTSTGNSAWNLTGTVGSTTDYLFLNGHGCGTTFGLISQAYSGHPAGRIPNWGDLYRIYVNCGSTYVFTTCGGTTADTKLSIWNASGLSFIAENDDDFGCSNFFASTLSWTSDFDGSVWVSVVEWPCSTVPDASSSYNLFFQCFSGSCVAPGNDDVCNVLAGSGFDLGTPTAVATTVPFDLNATTAEAFEVSPGPGTIGRAPSCDAIDGWCSFETDVDNSMWFSFTAPASGNVDIETITNNLFDDTQLALYEDVSGVLNFVQCVTFNPPFWTLLQEKAGNDDGGTFFQSRIFDECGYLNLIPGTRYYIQIDGYNGDKASGTLSIKAIPVGSTPTNDDCSNAEALACGATVTGNTTCASPDQAAVGFFCGTSISTNGVWYSVVGTGNAITLSTCNQADYDTKISVFEGSCGNLVCVGGQDDASGCSGFTTEYSFCSNSGSDYFVLVHGFGSGKGEFDLTATCHAALVADAGPDVEAVVAYANEAGCVTIGGSPAASGGLAPYTYAWTDAGGGSVGSTASIEVCVTSTATFTLTVTDAAGCTTSDDVTVEVDQTRVVDNYTLLSVAGGKMITGSHSTISMGVGVNDAGGSLWVKNDNNIAGWAAADKVKVGPNGSICAVFSDKSYLNQDPATTVIGSNGPCTLDVPAGVHSAPGSVYSGWSGSGNPDNLVRELPDFVSGDGSAGDVTVPNHTSMNIAPGAYDNITLGEGSSLTLDDGDYTANSIYTGPDATFGSATDAAAVKVYVDGDVRFKNKNNNINAMIYATGELEFGPNVVATGHFLGDPVNVGGGSDGVYNHGGGSWLSCIDITVSVTTDNWGNETTWQLASATDGVIATGGPYAFFSPATYTTVLSCQDPDACYIFTIYDSFGDGMCCSYGVGGWTVTAGATTTSSPSGGSFGDDETAFVGGDCSSLCVIEACVDYNTWGDDTEFSLTDANNNLIVDLGRFTGANPGFGGIACGAAYVGNTGPYTFNLTSGFVFFDNSGTWEVTCNGTTVGSGSFSSGGASVTASGLGCCNGSTPKSDAPSWDEEAADDLVVANSINAYPNPFSDVTTISFTLAEASNVSLEVYNTAGAQVANLYDDMAAEGTTNVQFDAQNLPVGIYMYRLTAGTSTFNGKLSVVK